MTSVFLDWNFMNFASNLATASYDGHQRLSAAASDKKHTNHACSRTACRPNWCREGRQQDQPGAASCWLTQKTSVAGKLSSFMGVLVSILRIASMIHRTNRSSVWDWKMHEVWRKVNRPHLSSTWFQWVHPSRFSMFFHDYERCWLT